VKWAFYAALVALLLGLCAFGGLGAGAVRGAGYAARLWPPDLSYAPRLAGPVVATVKMAAVGTTLALLTALPLSYCGCRSRNAFLYAATRLLLSVMRATPTLVLGIMFVAAMGLGATAGILGIWFHSTGALGKFMSETLDAADRSVQEAAVIDGATQWQAFVHVLVPMQANAFLSYYLYYLEANFREAVILGIVGAGGIGLELIGAIGMFRYHRTGLIVVVVIGTSLVLDFISRLVRQRFLERIMI
jgi:phosphonate transport system permease protein